MIKKFEEFINENLENEDSNIENVNLDRFMKEAEDNNGEIEDNDDENELNSIDTMDLPDVFTGDPKTDPYIAAVIYSKSKEYEKRMLNIKYRKPGAPTHAFNPYKKSQVEGNAYNRIWKSLVNWLQTKQKFENLSVLDKDRLLVHTFKKILYSQKGLVTPTEINRDTWRVTYFNKCKEKWEKLVKLSKDFFPNKNDEFARMQFVKKNFEKFITDEGIYKYAKNWIPELSRLYPVKM